MRIVLQTRGSKNLTLGQGIAAPSSDNPHRPEQPYQYLYAPTDEVQNPGLSASELMLIAWQI